MKIFDFHKIIIQGSADSLKKLSVFNPLTIRKKGTRAKAFFALALVCFFWGTTWLASKQGVSHMPALQMAGIRQLLGGTLYVSFFLFYKKMSLPRGREWNSVLILCLLNFVLSNGLSTWGVKFVSAGLGAIMGAIFPLWLVVIGLFSVGDKIPKKAIMGLLLGFSGVCLIFYEHMQDFLNPDFTFGIIISIIATWTWALGTLYTKSHAAGFNPYFSLGLQMLISGIITTTGVTMAGQTIPINEIPWQSWTAISFLVIFGSVVAFICYIYVLQNLPIEQASIYAYVNPIVAVFSGWLLFNESVTGFIIIGGLVTLAGVYLVNKAFKNVPPPEQPENEGV